MKRLWILFSFHLCLGTTYGLIECPRNDERCLCLPGLNFEYMCPKNYFYVGGVVLHFKQDANLLTIDCYPPSTTSNVISPKFFDVDLLPKVKIGRIYELNIRFCPLPERNFKEILEKLSITDLKCLKFGTSSTDSIRLSGSYLEGLESVESLIIEKNKLLILEDDVFDNTPNLIDIELTENDLQLSSEVFKKTTLLKSLDMSGNHLENLPRGLFRPLKNLTRLHLWNNNFTTIDEFMFGDLLNLKSLELSINNINSISENAFRNLKQLLQVTLRKNKLELIPANLFQGNPILQKVILTINPSLTLSDYLLSNFSSLEEVQLSYCNLESVPEHIFENSKNLRNISLSNNRLNSLPETLFSTLQNIEKVELQFNFLEDVSSVLANLRTLKELNLENNLITTLDRDTFGDLNNLVHLNLNRNRISQINLGVFDMMENLRTVRLSHNMITGETEDPYFGVIFQNGANLEEIDLSHNLITRVENIISMENKERLRKVDLRYNRITRIMLGSLRTVTGRNKLIIRLDNNNITTVDFHPFLDSYKMEQRGMDSYSNHDSYSEIHLANNPLKCDCRNYDLLRHLRMETSPPVLFQIPPEHLTCASPVELQDLPLETLPPQLLACPLEEMVEDYTECSDVCSCSWRPFDESMVINCSNTSLHTYPEIVLPPMDGPLRYNQSEIHLENNYLTTGPDSNLVNYGNVTKMYLSNNKISTVTWLPPRLQILKLDNNELTNLNYDVLKALNTTSLVNLTLSDNPWLCECGMEDLADFLWQHAKQVDFSNIYCSNTNRNIVYLNTNCSEGYMVYISIAVVAVLFSSAVIIVIVLRNRNKVSERTEKKKISLLY